MRQTKHIYQALLTKTFLFSLILLNLLNGAANGAGELEQIGMPEIIAMTPAQSAPSTDASLHTIPQMLDIAPPETPIRASESVPVSPESVPVSPESVPVSPVEQIIHRSASYLNEETQSLCSGQTGYSNRDFFDPGMDLTPESAAPNGILRWCLDGTSRFELIASWKPIIIRNPREALSSSLTPCDYIKHILFNIPGALQQQDSLPYLREQVNHFLLATLTTEPLSQLGKLLPFKAFTEETHTWAAILKKNPKNPNRRQQLILSPIEAGRRATPIIFETYKLDRRIAGVTWPFSPKVALARVVQIVLSDPSKLSKLQNQYFTCNPQGELIILKEGIENPEIVSVWLQAEDIVRLNKETWNATDLKKARVLERELDLAGYISTVDSQAADKSETSQNQAQNFFIIRNRQMFTRNLASPRDRLLCHNVLPTGMTDCIDPAVVLCGKIKDNFSTNPAPWFTVSELPFPDLYQVKVYSKNPVKFLQCNKEPTEIPAILGLMDGLAVRLVDEMPKKSIKLEYPSSP